MLKRIPSKSKLPIISISKSITLNMSKIGITFATLAILLMLTACKTQKDFNYLTHTNTASEIDKMQIKLDKVYAMLLGHFSNQEQADTSSSIILGAQELINVPFWRDRTGEYWFYSGWFKDGFVENALRENLFQLTKKARDTFELRMYKMPKDQDYSMVWQEEKPFSHLHPADLTESCVFYIVDNRRDNIFKLYTPSEPCEQDFSGDIDFVDYVIDLNAKQQQHFSIFYNKNKEMVMRYPRPNGLIFKRLNKNKPKYTAEEE
jgi:hypothetical protein